MHAEAAGPTTGRDFEPGFYKADVASPLTSSQTERGSRADAVDTPSWSDAARQVHVHHHKALDLTNDLIRSGC
jgi:hypothetical protein